MDTHIADLSADTINSKRYRLAQRAELQIRFHEALGRGGRDRAERLPGPASSGRRSRGRHCLRLIWIERRGRWICLKWSVLTSCKHPL